MKLHLGCFDSPIEGWINTDITPHIIVSRIPGMPLLLYRLGKITADRFRHHQEGVFRQVRRMDLSKTFPFKDNCFDAVYWSHVLEHLPVPTAQKCLKEIFRVLTPGGVLRTSVPDLDTFVNHYDPTDPAPFLDAMFESRQVRDKNRHHWMYNEASLTQLLLDIGFKNVFRCEFRQGQCPDIELLDNRADISLFMEAIKT
jgi:SAM-dependent methyltransferase